jgi:hypothetical protein
MRKEILHPVSYKTNKRSVKWQRGVYKTDIL